MKDRMVIRMLLLLTAFFAFSRTEAGTIQWVEDTYEDFADGTLDAGGQNIYVSRDGTVRTIHRFDINQDGWLDLFFGNTHDNVNLVAPVVCSVTEEGRIEQKELGVLGSNRVKSADLNRDGFTDLVFSIGHDGLQTPRRFLSIMYGGKDGWTNRRIKSALPVYRPRDIEITDLNADGWPDIAVINSLWRLGKKYKGNIWVYWGSENGFSYDRFLKINVPRARKFVSGDFDNDKGTDLAVLSRKGHVEIFWAKAAEGPNDLKEPKELESTKITLPDTNSNGLSIVAVDCNSDGIADLVIGTDSNDIWIVYGQEKRDSQKIATSTGFPAADIAAGDMDKDGWQDLVLVYFSISRAAGGEAAGAGEDTVSTVKILWGGNEGFSTENCTKLPANLASIAAVGDLNGDGNLDIALGVYQGKESFSAESLVYFGRGDRKFELGEHKIQTEGVTDVVIVPAEKGMAARAVFSNSLGGTPFEVVPAYLYWGGKDGFSKTDRWEIPAKSAHEASAADLNTDGFVDLIVMNTTHGGKKPTGKNLIGANIWWGSAKGFDIKRRTVLHEETMASSNIADLNHDGFLDLVLGDYAGKPGEVVVYYGSDDGFDPNNKQVVESKGRSDGTIIADFNKDSWLDIAVTSYNADRARIFWGSAAGFDTNSQQQLPIPTPVGIESADLNADGFLDLIVAAYKDEVHGYFDMGNQIFWGSEQGFRYWDSQWLPGNCTLFQTVADFDDDGFLDLFCPNYHGQTNRDNLPSFLYWGGKDGFSPRRKKVFLCDSAADAYAGDFDRDGRIDIAVSCHTMYGSHQAKSKVFYNDGNRFANPKVVNLPTLGSHSMWMQDMGHIYDRKHRQRYESSVFEWDRSAKKGRLSYRADMPKGVKLAFKVRSSVRKSTIADQPWHQVKSGKFSLGAADRFLQYQAEFISDNGDRYPVLDRVEIRLITRR